MSSRAGKASSRGTKSEPSVSLQLLLKFLVGIGAAVIAAKASPSTPTDIYNMSVYKRISLSEEAI